VHLVCGIWGTLAVGIFGAKAGLGQLGIQAVGVVAAGIAAFGSAIVFFLIAKMLVGLRVSAEEEMEGLDMGEHGMQAYPDFGPAMVGSGLMTGPAHAAARQAAGAFASATELRPGEV